MAVTQLPLWFFVWMNHFHVNSVDVFTLRLDQADRLGLVLGKTFFIVTVAQLSSCCVAKSSVFAIDTSEKDIVRNVSGNIFVMIWGNLNAGFEWDIGWLLTSAATLLFSDFAKRNLEGLALPGLKTDCKPPDEEDDGADEQEWPNYEHGRVHHWAGDLKTATIQMVQKGRVKKKRKKEIS